MDGLFSYCWRMCCLRETFDNFLANLVTWPDPTWSDPTRPAAGSTRPVSSSTYLTDHGGGGVLPRPHAPPGQSACSPGTLVGALGWSGAGPERWLMSVPQVLYIGWSSSYGFEPGAPPTAAWRRCRTTVTALETSSRCPPGDWGSKLGPRLSGFFPPYKYICLIFTEKKVAK